MSFLPSFLQCLKFSLLRPFGLPVALRLPFSALSFSLSPSSLPCFLPAFHPSFLILCCIVPPAGGSPPCPQCHHKIHSCSSFPPPSPSPPAPHNASISHLDYHQHLFQIDEPESRDFHIYKSSFWCKFPHPAQHLQSLLSSHQSE